MSTFKNFCDFLLREKTRPCLLSRISVTCLYGRGGNDGGGRSACGGEVGPRGHTLAHSHTAHACIASACIALVRWCAARQRQLRKRRRDSGRARERKTVRGEVAVHACAGGQGSGLLLTLACVRTRWILCPDAPLPCSVGALSVCCSLLPACKHVGFWAQGASALSVMARSRSRHSEPRMLPPRLNPKRYTLNPKP
jgi:hypothetical protein